MNHLACMTTFVAVVDKGGFAPAARHLAIAPTSVTQQIHILEHRIGARLLQRTTRKSTLTEAGEVFYERVVKILADIAEADAIANAFHTTSRGTLRLNTSPSLSKDVSALVARYAAVHPETSFDLATTNQMGSLLDERIDLAIRDDAVIESSFIVRRLARAEWTACASPGHVARHGLPTHPAELAGYNCLIYVRDRDGDDWRFADHGGTTSVRVSGSLRSRDPHVLRTAALSDQGLVLLPDAMVSEDLQAGRLVRILNGHSAEQATIRAIYPSRELLSLKVRMFLDFAATTFAAAAAAAAEHAAYAPVGLRSVVESLASVRARRSFGNAINAAPAA
jgi:DNA-binding transcriptional LysR family regulator